MELRLALESICIADAQKESSEKQLIVPTPRDARDKAKKMVGCIWDGVFWYKLLRYVYSSNVVRKITTMFAALSVI